MRPGVLLEHRDLLERMNHELQVMPGCAFELTGTEYAFEHYDRMPDARGPQRSRFLDARHAESVRVGKRTRCVNEAVTVRVGFDCRDDTCGRCEAADYRKVVA
jgi:hypothetical protein